MNPQPLPGGSPSSATGILWSQIALSLQLPFTIVPLFLLTSSREEMGSRANSRPGAALLWLVGVVVILLNAALLLDSLGG